MPASDLPTRMASLGIALAHPVRLLLSVFVRSQDEPAVCDPTPSQTNFREKLHDCGLVCCRSP
jgi:hypothetical protein